MQDRPASTASAALRRCAKIQQIASPWTWRPLADGGAAITSRPRGYEPKDFTFTADEIREAAQS